MSFGQILTPSFFQPLPRLPADFSSSLEVIRSWLPKPTQIFVFVMMFVMKTLYQFVCTLQVKYTLLNFLVSYFPEEKLNPQILSLNNSYFLFTII